MSGGEQSVPAAAVLEFERHVPVVAVLEFERHIPAAAVLVERRVPAAPPLPRRCSRLP